MRCSPDMSSEGSFSGGRGEGGGGGGGVDGSETTTGSSQSSSDSPGFETMGTQVYTFTLPDMTNLPDDFRYQLDQIFQINRWINRVAGYTFI